MSMSDKSERTVVWVSRVTISHILLEPLFSVKETVNRKQTQKDKEEVLFNWITGEWRKKKPKVERRRRRRSKILFSSHRSLFRVMLNCSPENSEGRWKMCKSDTSDCYFSPSSQISHVRQVEGEKVQTWQFDCQFYRRRARRSLRRFQSWRQHLNQWIQPASRRRRRRVINCASFSEM